MDETGCFFKALPKRVLAEKIQARDGKKSKTRLTIVFSISAAGEKVIESIVIWRSAKPRYFKNLINPKRSYTCITIQVRNHRWQAKLWIPC